MVGQKPLPERLSEAQTAFVERDGGFDIWIGGQMIMRHRPASPAIQLAIGNAEIEMIRGNFKSMTLLKNFLL